MAIIGDEVTINVAGRGTFMQALFDALLTRGYSGQNPSDIRRAVLKTVNSEYAYLLAQKDLGDLRDLVNSLPRPSGSFSIGFTSETGLSAGRIAMMLFRDEPDWAQNGISLTFSYDPAGLGNSN